MVNMNFLLFKKSFMEIKFTYHEANHLKLCNAPAFSTFAVLCNHRLHPVPESFITKGNPIPLLQPLAARPALAAANQPPSLRTDSFCLVRTNGSRPDVTFQAGSLHSVMLLGFTPLVACVRAAFLFTAE